jgi:TRAP-type C4-dicarboxylate transport system permease small subunit
MERTKNILGLKSERQARLVVLLVSTAIIIITSLLAYNRITYEFALAVGNTGQSALGPPTSAGVGIVYAMIVVAAILGFGAVLSVFGSLRNMSNRISNVVRESLPAKSDSESKPKDEWEHVSTNKETKATDDEILKALWHSKDEKSATAE